ncbi:MAG: hypothetical protein SX243_16950 [Acidobacteriota bacterium]|nr:hypothetical protein [Acidobacteriota bacterium]
MHTLFRLFIWMLLITGCLAAPAPGWADEPGESPAAEPPAVTAEADALPMVWNRYYTVRPGFRDRFLELMVGRTGPALDRLVQEGTLLSWGIARPFNLVEDRWTYMVWFSMPDWAEADRVTEAMEELQASFGPQAVTELEDTLVPNSRRDRVLRHLVVGPHPPAASAEAPLYIRLGFHRAREGRADAVRPLYEALHLPLCNRLALDGVVLHCGLSEQELVAEQDWTHLTWWILPSLEDLGTLQTAFDQAASASSSGEKQAADSFWERYRDTFDRSAYRTAVYRIVHLGGGTDGKKASPDP